MKVQSSLGAKLAIVCILCLSVVAAIAAGFNILQVRMLKEQMLRGSERLAEEKARALADELAQLDREIPSVNSDQTARRRALLDRIKLFIKRNDEVILAGVIEVGDQGIKRVIVSDFRDPNSRQQVLGSGGSFEAELSEGDEEALKVVLQQQDEDMPVSLTPLQGTELSGLHLALAVRDSETYRQIESAGRMITRRVAIMAGLLSGALILAFLGVWILFNNQARLIRENEQLNKMAYIGTLAGGLAHEIRNPLNAMSLNLGVVQEDLDDPQEDSDKRVRQIIGRLSREVEQLKETVVSFLAFAVPKEIQREFTRPATIVRDVLADLEEEIRSRGVEVEVDLSDSTQIEGDRAGLRQVFHNVILNALEAMTGPIRRLGIRQWQEGPSLRIDISDTGEGIRPEHLEKIFEPFHTQKARGTGFGLPIAQRIVRNHGGRIWAKPDLVTGATFCLEFPLPSRRQRA